LGKTLREAVIEIVAIAKECPEPLQVVCFELLLKKHLESSETRHDKDKGGDVKNAPALSKEAPAAKTNAPLKDSPGRQEDLVNTDLHVKVQRFMQKCGVSIEEMNNLFFKDGDAMSPLYEDLKTTRMAEGQTRIALLQSLQAAIPSGEFQTSVEDVRKEAVARKCYDSTNFGKNFTNNASLFDFERWDKTIRVIKLSDEGRTELAKLIKALQ
jgi:hypothetical protein